jgi:hypothetical protein
VVVGASEEEATANWNELGPLFSVSHWLSCCSDGRLPLPVPLRCWKIRVASWLLKDWTAGEVDVGSAGKLRGAPLLVSFRSCANNASSVCCTDGGPLVVELTQWLRDLQRRPMSRRARRG